jgi:hypothetical protein
MIDILCDNFLKYQKYEWNKMTYNKIYTILSFEKIFQIINLMNTQN